MDTMTLNFETTPVFFGLWLEDATMHAEILTSTVFVIQPQRATGGLYNGRWRWEVGAWSVSQATGDAYELRLYTFEVIPTAPTRIKVKAASGELGRAAFDALIARMCEELPLVQQAQITRIKDKPEPQHAPRPRGRPTRDLEQKLEVWRNWLNAKERGYPTKTAFCQQQDPPIRDTKTLNSWRDQLIFAGYLTEKGEII